MWKVLLLICCILPLSHLPAGSLLAQAPASLLARIGVVKADPARADVLRILGSAGGTDFSGFSLEFGQGEFPEGWRPILRSDRSVAEGLLGEWDTADLPAGAYTVRLTVQAASGERFSDRTLIELQAFRPELTVRHLRGEIRGAYLQVFCAVQNLGPQPAVRSFAVDFYLSEGPSLRPTARHLGSQRLARVESQALVEVEARLPIPDGAPDGAYHLLARVDGQGQVAEGREDNNEASAHDLILLFPDPAVSELNPVLQDKGTRVSVQGKVRNQGSRPVKGPFTAQFYLSTDGAIDPADPVLGRETLPPLPARAESVFQASYPLSEALPAGRYYVLALLDPEQAVGQRDRANDAFWGSPVVLGPDLRVADLRAEISRDGKEIFFRDAIVNEGRFPATAPFSVHYFLAPEKDPASERFLGAREVAGLPAGLAQEGQSSFALEELPQGSYAAVARIDPEGRLQEMDRTNNSYRLRPLPLGPDLVLEELSAELLPSGEEARVRFVVGNQGSLPVGRAFSVGLFLSGDAQLDSAEDSPLGDRAVRDLQPGESVAGEFVVSLGARSDLGRTWLLARADPEGVVSEVRLDNNTASAGRLLEKEVDLVVTALTANLLSDGGRIVVNDAVRNQGSEGLAQPFSVAFYLSGNGVVDSEDLYLGERRIPGLEAGALSRANTTLVLPLQVGVGKLSILARVDPDRRIRERREDNNDYWGSSLHLGPDLTLSDLSGTPSADGAEIGLQVGVGNRGNRPTPADFRVGFYLSDDPQLDSGDRLLGEQTLGPLGAASDATVRATLPVSSVENGNYILLARADPEDAVAEVDEGNNHTIGGAIPLGPDLAIESLKAALTLEDGRTAVRIEDEVLNRGNRPAPGEVRLFFILSKNWSVDRSDVYLGERTVAALGPGERSGAVTLLPIPKKEVPTGRYFVLARVDAAGVLSETNERNNMRPTLVPLVVRWGN